MFFGEPFGGVVPGPRGAVLATLMRTDAPLTGRQVHGLLDDRHSLWAVQQALKDLEQLGMTTVSTVGRAGVHHVNEDHLAVAQLRPLLSPLDALARVAREVVGDEVETVAVFGSVARGETHATSDVDLAVVAHAGWDRRVELEDAVRSRLGNTCDVLHLTPYDLTRPPTQREPVVAQVLRDGMAIIGSLPRPDRTPA